MKKIRPLVLLSIALSVASSLGAIVFASCGTFDAAHDGFDSSSPAGGQPGVGGQSSGTGGATSGGAGGGSSCALECNGVCVDSNADNANCGACGVACPSDQTCQSGSCACTAGRVQCGTSATCVDTNSDPNNCGACGTACTGNQVCSGGSCTTSCGTLTECSGACVDLTNTLDHCGACTTVCSAANGETCTGGSCQCTSGLTSCTGSGCKNLQTDSANCGTCGNACASGMSCTGGTCTCGGGTTNCSGSCKNLQTDSANCGACGTACGTGQTCSGGSCTGGQGMCDLLAAAGNACTAAHSTTRALYAAYTGPLYQVCRGSFRAGPGSCTSGQTRDIGVVAGGYADAAAQDTFCSGGSCTITKIYDQSPNGNILEPSPAGGYKRTPDNPASATDLRTTLNGHTVYGILIKPGLGYRTGCSGCTIKTGIGIATGDQAESMYWVTSQSDLVNGCCFDYGNAETTSNDDGNGTMEALYFGLGVVWGTGVNGGPWIEADLENGLYAGWENGQDRNISTNTPLKYNFVTGVLVGDVASRNSGAGRFALYGGDATTGTLKTMYDGIRPAKQGYVPMHKQGSIILGTGGDNSDSAGGRVYEGVMTNGAWSLATVNAVQANVVAARYGK